MKRSLVGMLAALALALGVRAIPASAADAEIEFASHAELMSVLEEQNNRLAELEAGMTSGGEGGGCSSCGSSCGTCGGCSSCCNDCCHSTGIYVEGELTFFRYHRADGVRAQPFAATLAGPADLEFGFEMAPRITLGYVGEDGLGARTRWWSYDHEATASRDVLLNNETSSLAVDTYTWDLELFDTFRLNCNWTLELSGGVRYNEFDEEFTNRLTLLGIGVAGNQFESDFAGFGGLVGAELRRAIGDNFAVFFSTKASILMDDDNDRVTITGPLDIVTLNQRETQIDDVKGMLELQLGVEHRQSIGEGAYVFAQFSGEWQMWMNYGNQWDVYTLAVPFEEHETDVGFGGFGFSLGVGR